MTNLPHQHQQNLYDQNDGINTCYLCGNPRFKKHYDVKYFGVPCVFYQCECGLIKQAPMPNDNFFEWFFNQEIFFSSKNTDQDNIWGYYDYFSDEANRMATSKLRHKRLSSILDKKKPANILKIGPATGTFLYLANQKGHNAIGCDISEQFIEYAHKNYKVHIDHGRFEKLPYKDEQFDIIFLFNVIENVPNQAEFLNAILKKLNKGGYFIFNYVDMNNNLIELIQKDKYFMYRPPICYAYPQKTLYEILDKFGFYVEKKLFDFRILNIEKILSLLGWNTLLKIAQKLKLNRMSFPVYAYPSKIIVARKK